jgi:tetratricopeptide (TPR) repeat protein
MRQPISNDYIFKQYYTENIIDITRDDKNNEAIVKFQQKDFNAASELFLNILSKDTSNIAVYFYYGISNIETKNYNIAINTFNKIIKQNDNLYIEHAEWYKGLCYLKSNQKNKAINEFTKIANNPDNYYNKKAKDILEKLN